MFILAKDKSHKHYPTCILSNVSFLDVCAKILYRLSLYPAYNFIL